jgi:putative colanic acid biosynthesis acetyltransferase WcaF
MNKTDLSKFNNAWYQPGNGIKRGIWYFTSLVFFESGFPFNGIKIFILKLFGTTLGHAVVIKPHVRIKYPWKLTIGSNCWIGEEVWIDNLAEVKISDNCCLSQGAMLLCGNHNYSKSTFDLMVKEIILEDGVWIGAKSVVCPGVLCKSHAVLSVGSIATSDLDAYSIYQGNPATKVKERTLVS